MPTRTIVRIEWVDRCARIWTADIVLADPVSLRNKGRDARRKILRLVNVRETAKSLHPGTVIPGSEEELTYSRMLSTADAEWWTPGGLLRFMSQFHFGDNPSFHVRDQRRRMPRVVGKIKRVRAVYGRRLRPMLSGKFYEREENEALLSRISMEEHNPGIVPAGRTKEDDQIDLLLYGKSEM
jgi:hypothetical protein